MANFLTKIFGTHSSHELKKIYPIADKVDALEEQFKKLTDDELRAKTDEFKQRYQNGETLDQLLPEAFATCREAAWRVLGMRHYRVQIIGGIVLHQGRIAEMKTGEGKTLVATLPAYLNALTGKGVHIVTVNDYLAKRDSEWMGKVYRFLGLKVGLVIHEVPPQARKAMYAADITYGTNNEFGFDYLRDNMAIYKNAMVQRDHAFAIVDEVDSILIDEARTPLIISGQGEKSSQLYEIADRFAAQLSCLRVKEVDAKEEQDDIDADYIVDEKAKTATLTPHGQKRAEAYFKVENLSDPANTTLQHHINQAIKARGVMQRDVDYVVRDGQVIIVDEFTGRLMFGRRYNEGLHQAIEAKEGVKVEHESKTLATITFQNYFRLYGKLSGMTGTALTEEEEFRHTYQLDVIEIPTNKPVARKDNPDAVYKNERGKIMATIARIEQCHAKGQPILVGTVSIEKSEELSKILKAKGIKHTVLNAKYHEREAEIVAQAGKPGAVTIATNMAGRGTDIMLGGNAETMALDEIKKYLRHEVENRVQKGEMDERVAHDYIDHMIYEANGHADTDDQEVLAIRAKFEELYSKFKTETDAAAEKVRAAGGLYILGTERHESRRIDNQLRGRSGRQGDPGESRFYLSLEDDLMRLFNTQLVARVMAKGMPEGEPIEAKSVSKGVRTAQKTVEARNFEIRKNVLKYDDVMNKQRTVIYSERQAVLKGEDIHGDIERFIADTIDSYIEGAQKGSSKPSDWDWDGLFKALKTVFPFELDQDAAKNAADKLKGDKAVAAVRDSLVDQAREEYAELEEKVGEEGLRQLERRVVLAVLDRKWREHLYEMDYLKDGIGLRGMGQRDPLVEYQREGYQMYNSMIEAIKEESVQLLFHVDVQQVSRSEEAGIESDDAAVDEAEEAVGAASSEVDKAEDAGEAETAEESDEKVAIAQSAKESAAGEATAPITGPAPISHAEGKVPANKRPKNEELKTPWSDGRTFPGTSKNAQCPCGSGRKYKMCHGQNEE